MVIIGHSPFIIQSTRTFSQKKHMRLIPLQLLMKRKLLKCLVSSKAATVWLCKRSVVRVHQNAFGKMMFYHFQMFFSPIFMKIHFCIPFVYLKLTSFFFLSLVLKNHPHITNIYIHVYTYIYIHVYTFETSRENSPLSSFNPYFYIQQYIYIYSDTHCLCLHGCK